MDREEKIGMLTDENCHLQATMRQKALYLYFKTRHCRRD